MLKFLVLNRTYILMIGGNEMNVNQALEELKALPKESLKKLKEIIERIEKEK